MSSITEELIRDTQSLVNRVEVSHKKPWQRWIDAEFGLRNYWYPAALSQHLPEGKATAIRLLGEGILLTRQNGKLYALEDRCCHRGVRFSRRPLFYTKETLTCWYHTFTYNLDDGKLRCVLNEPNCALVGKVGVKTYPIREAKGAVFVFVGDIDPPDLSADLPPNFLDDDMAIAVAEPYEVKANWRLGCENGFDPGHHFIHNWSRWTLDASMPMAFGWLAKKEDLLKVTTYNTTEPGPKGFTRIAANTQMFFEATIPGRNGTNDVRVTLPTARTKTPEQIEAMMQGIYKATVGLWLPCGLKVDPWPAPPIIHYEFYVPKDDGVHTYFQFGGLRVKSAEEHDRWVQEDAHSLWEVPVVVNFTVDDAFARESMQPFYGDEDGWYRERLYQPDIEITTWRKFASDHARGVQTRDHVEGFRKR